MKYGWSSRGCAQVARDGRLSGGRSVRFRVYFRFLLIPFVDVNGNLDRNRPECSILARCRCGVRSLNELKRGTFFEMISSEAPFFLSVPELLCQ